MKSLLLIVMLQSAIAQQNTTKGLAHYDTVASFNGYTLFGHEKGRIVYLIDNMGQVVHYWKSAFQLGRACMLLEDGTLLRTGVAPGSFLNSGGYGGIVEKVDWDGNVRWRFRYSSPIYRAHHDLEILPNGNVLIMAWVSHSASEALAAGRLPSRLKDSTLYSEQIIEVRPTGTETGEIVWAWDSWDHMIQDIDPTKSNYGVVSQNPDKVDINAGEIRQDGGGDRSDWLHANAVRYNPVRDEVMLSVRNLHEVWIISRKTNRIVFRWGNPAIHKMGLPEDQQLFGQHDARWLPNDWSRIMVFNNGDKRPQGSASSIDIIELPSKADGSYQIADQTHTKTTSSNRIYPHTLSPNFYSRTMSGATMMPNGNVLTCLGELGVFIETTPDMREVWRYVSPVGENGMNLLGDNRTFRVYRYARSYGAFVGKNLKPLGRLEDGSFSPD